MDTHMRLVILSFFFDKGGKMSTLDLGPRCKDGPCVHGHACEGPAALPGVFKPRRECFGVPEQQSTSLRYAP